MSSGDTACLMARAAPNSDTVNTPNKVSDDVVAKLESLCIKGKNEKIKDDKEKSKKKHAFVDNVSPVDFLNYQNAKSSFLARKMKTAAKLHRVGPELFAELLQHPGKTKDEEEKAAKDGNERSRDEGEKVKSGFIARGPSRIERTPISHHPYGDSKGQSYGTAPKRTDTKNPYYHVYENNYTWTDSPETIGYNSNNSSPGTYQADMGYFSSSPQQQPSPFPQCPLSDLDRYLEGENVNAKETSHEEVPKIISDFILTYSRPYSASTSEDSADPRDTERHSRNSSFSESSDKARRHSTDSGCDSPMSAGSAPHCSPNAPRGTSSGQTYYNENGNYINDPDGSQKELRKRAKERFRDILTEKEYDDGQLWAIRVYKELSNRNHCLDQKQYDGDTLLHIVTSNRDYGKIYALSELLLKNDMVCSSNPIDVRNDQNETPLFKAVEYRCRPEAIEYFLALGADPNVQPMQNGKPIKDPPLHYAASHSMPEIVQVLCKKADINMLNGYGYTPLLCAALKHNHLVCKETGLRLDNIESIKILLANGANPRIYDRKSQRSLLSEVYEKMEPELSEILKAHLDERVYYDMTNQELTNGPNYYQDPQEQTYPNQGYCYVDYAEQPYKYN